MLTFSMELDLSQALSRLERQKEVRQRHSRRHSRTSNTARPIEAVTTTADLASVITIASTIDKLTLLLLPKSPHTTA